MDFYLSLSNLVFFLTSKHIQTEMENTNNTKPQVFISFRGKDARERFLPLLKDRLKRSKVNVFTDEDAAGVPLEHLLEEIRNSRIAVVLLSKNYAESHWCLNELVEIKKCIETKKLDFVIPVFSKVKTSHVKKQTGSLGKSFWLIRNLCLLKQAMIRRKISVPILRSRDGREL